jgi:superfamily II DNA/RNA helicase
VTVEVARANATASTVEQHFYSVTDDDKRAAVRQILKQRELSQAIVFVNSKLGAARLARAFERDGLRTSALHGDKSQDERLKALAAFKRAEVDVLVCTDVAARGLDIADLPAVFNYDVPFNAEDYVHRIGRTGRAGASGLAVTLVTREDARNVSDIEKLIHKKIELEPFEVEDDRPRRGPRRFDDEGGRRERGAFDRERDAAGPGRVPPARVPAAPAKPRDPFFDRPYEASVPEGAKPSWEKDAAATPSAPVGRAALSANIRSKRKVAALLGGGPKS